MGLMNTATIAVINKGVDISAFLYGDEFGDDKSKDDSEYNDEGESYNVKGSPAFFSPASFLKPGVVFEKGLNSCAKEAAESNINNVNITGNLFIIKLPQK